VTAIAAGDRRANGQIVSHRGIKSTSIAYTERVARTLPAAQASPAGGGFARLLI
jgi:hypothetical protein